MDRIDQYVGLQYFKMPEFLIILVGSLEGNRNGEKVFFFLVKTDDELMN